MLHWLWGEGQRRGLHPDPGTAPHSCRATAASWCQFRLAPWCPEPARAQEPASGWWGKEVERWQLGVPPALAVCQMSSKPTSAVPSRGIRGLGCLALGCRWVTGGLSCLHALPLAKRCRRDSSTWLPHYTKPIFCSCPPLGGGLWMGAPTSRGDSGWGWHVPTLTARPTVAVLRGGPLALRRQSPLLGSGWEQETKRGLKSSVVEN